MTAITIVRPWTSTHSLTRVTVARVRSGEMALGISMYPTTIDQLLAVADAGETEDEAEEPAVGPERPGGDTPGLFRDEKDGRRHLLAEAGAPRFFLQAHGVGALGVRREGADDGPIGKRYVLHTEEMMKWAYWNSAGGRPDAQAGPAGDVPGVLR